MRFEWDKFSVLTTKGDIPKETGWHREAQVFPAETCSRHIYVGMESSFDNLPDELLADKKSHLFIGRDAYIFLGKFIAGLKGHYLVDEHVLGQFRRAWNDYREKNPQDYKKLQQYIDALLYDTAEIKESILKSYLSRPTPVNTAVRTAELSPHHNVLVVGGARAITVETITALGHKKQDTPNRVTLTHPDELEMEQIVDDLQGFGKQRAIKAELVTIPFDQAFQNCEDATSLYTANAVFVCQPMQDDDVNGALVEAWQNRLTTREGTSGRLFHLKGDPFARGNTTGRWTKFDHVSGFVSYTDIVKKNAGRIASVQAVVKAAEKAVEDLAEFRLDGKRVAINYDGYFLDYVLLPRPRKSSPVIVRTCPFAKA